MQESSKSSYIFMRVVTSFSLSLLVLLFGLVMWGGMGNDQRMYWVLCTIVSFIFSFAWYRLMTRSKRRHNWDNDEPKIERRNPRAVLPSLRDP